MEKKGEKKVKESEGASHNRVVQGMFSPKFKFMPSARHHNIAPRTKFRQLQPQFIVGLVFCFCLFWLLAIANASLLDHCPNVYSLLPCPT
mmetsp:Transcript_14451/g.20499  ORF Transcript_14451/g.20499 Transcript_14451/m.20499 type:complete len:90 (-) Transcript_14451:2853-3122(-)